MKTLPITLRPAGPDDEPLIFELYASTRAQEMTLVPWSDEQKRSFIRMQLTAQQDHYKQKYPKADHEIILAHGKPIGRLYVARLDDEIRIVDIVLLPEVRGNGVGTQILETLLAEGKMTGKIIRIYVESFNPSLKLFQRLGFVEAEQHGIHVLLQWSADSY